MTEPSVEKKVMKWASHFPSAKPFATRELLHLGNRAAVYQALSRLCASGSLRRIVRGIYVVAEEGRFGPRIPETTEVVAKIAEARGEIIVRHGASAANLLGLTTQNPLREIYLTSGASRKIEIGRITIEFRHAPPWQLLYPNEIAGQVVRALAWLGEENAERSVSELRHRELSVQEKNALLSARQMLPSWLARAVSTLAV